MSLLKRQNLRSRSDAGPDELPQGISSVTVPERRAADWVVVISLFLFSCVYLRAFYNYTNLFSDEGIVLQGAQRILQGQVLYRDFFSLVTPGSYYWMALLFRVFGNSILVARAALVIYGGIFSVLTYLVSRRVCSRTISLVVSSLVTITCLPYYFMALHNWDSTLWAYLAIYCSVKTIESDSRMWPALTGMFAALTCLVEQSKGAGLILGLLLGLFLLSLRQQGNKSRIPTLWYPLIAGFACPFVATFAYFGFKHGLVQMLAAWLWPLHHYSGANKAFYGQSDLSTKDVHTLFSGPWLLRFVAAFALAPCFIVPALPLAAVASLGYGIHRLRRIVDSQETARYYVVVSATLTGLLLATIVTGRPDLIHIMFQAPMFFLILAWALAGKDLPQPGFKRLSSFISSCVVFGFVAFGLALLWQPLNAHFWLETRRGNLKASGTDAALAGLQSRMAPGSRVFVYPNQPLFYYLTATENPTRFDTLFPAVSTPEEFEEALREVQQNRTPVVMFEPGYVLRLPVSRSSMPLDALAAPDIAAKFLRDRYKYCQTLNSGLQGSLFVFMVRKDLNCEGPFDLARDPVL